MEPARIAMLYLLRDRGDRAVEYRNSGCLPVSPHGEFAPTSTRQSSDQVLQIYPSHTEKKRQYCAHDETKHVYFSFFNPLKVTCELEIESLG